MIDPVVEFLRDREKLSLLVYNLDLLREKNPKLAKGLGKVVEDFRNDKISYEEAKKIIAEKMEKAGLKFIEE